MSLMSMSHMKRTEILRTVVGKMESLRQVLHCLGHGSSQLSPNFLSATRQGILQMETWCAVFGSSCRRAIIICNLQSLCKSWGATRLHLQYQFWLGSHTFLISSDWEMACRMTWTMVGASCVDDSLWSVATSYNSSLQHNFGIQAFRRWVAFSIRPATGKLPCRLLVLQQGRTNFQTYTLHVLHKGQCEERAMLTCHASVDLAFLETDVLQSFNELLLGAANSSLL